MSCRSNYRERVPVVLHGKNASGPIRSDISGGECFGEAKVGCILSERTKANRLGC